ncbi:hypothetical protein ACO22_07574, partial [Paracoccidioides brasiliensis]
SLGLSYPFPSLGLLCRSSSWPPCPSSLPPIPIPTSGSAPFARLPSHRYARLGLEGLSLLPSPIRWAPLPDGSSCPDYHGDASVSSSPPTTGRGRGRGRGRGSGSAKSTPLYSMEQSLSAAAAVPHSGRTPLPALHLLPPPCTPCHFSLYFLLLQHYYTTTTTITPPTTTTTATATPTPTTPPTTLSMPDSIYSCF